MTVLVTTTSVVNVPLSSYGLTMAMQLMPPHYRCGAETGVRDSLLFSPRANAVFIFPKHLPQLFYLKLQTAPSRATGWRLRWLTLGLPTPVDKRFRSSAFVHLSFFLSAPLCAV